MTDPTTEPHDVEDTNRGETPPLPDPDGEASRDGGSNIEGLDGPQPDLIASESPTFAHREF